MGALGAGLGGLVAPLGPALLHADLCNLDLPGQGLGRARRRGLVPAAQRKPVDHSARIAPGTHARLRQHHGVDQYLAAQRLHIAQRHIQPLELQQFLAPGIAQLGLVQRELAAHLHQRLLHLLEADFHIGIEPARDDLYRQRIGQISEVVGQVQALECQAQLRGAGGEKRRAERRGVELAAIERERQPRRDPHFARRRQGAQKRQAQLQVTHLMRALDKRILKIHRTTLQLDVVERKALRFGLVFGRRGSGQPLQDIVYVIVPRAGLRQMQHRRVDFDRIEHRSQAQQRLHFGIHIYTLHRQQRLGGPRQAVDAQAVERQLECPGLELHGFKRHGAAELFRAQPLDLAFEHGGHGKPQQQPQREKGRQRQRGVAQGPFSIQRFHGVLKVFTAPGPRRRAGAIAPENQSEQK